MMSTAVWAQQPREKLAKRQAVKAETAYGARNALAGQPRRTFTPVIDSTEMITEAPKGTTYQYVNRSGYAYALTYYGLTGDWYEEQPGTFIVTDDAIYIKNAITQLASVKGQPDHYLKLSRINDTTYVAHMPQAISIDYGRTRYAARVVKYVRQSDGLTAYKPDTLADGSVDYDVTFRYKDGILSQLGCSQDPDDNLPTEIIGQIDSDGGWYAYGDAFMVVDPIKEVPARKPDDVATRKCVLKYSYRSLMDGSITNEQMVLDVAVDGNDIYIQDPATGETDQWIKGTIDGDKVTISTQYLGVWNDFRLNAWVMPTTFTEGTDALYNQSVRNYVYQPQLVMTYDETAQTLTCPEGWGFCVNGREDGSWPMVNCDEAQISPFDDGPKVPAAPYYDATSSFSAYRSDWGYGFFSAYIPQSDVNGEAVNPAKLYYRVYMDSDTPYALSSDDYALTPDSCVGMAEIPWNYTDNRDIFAGTGYATWYFYRDITEKLGLQSVYISDGVENASPIAWLYPQADGTYTTAGIAQPRAHAGTKTSQWFDIMGRKVQAPQGKGIYIQRTTDGSGKVHVQKIIRR